MISEIVKKSLQFVFKQIIGIFLRIHVFILNLISLGVKQDSIVTVEQYLKLVHHVKGKKGYR